MLGLCMFTEYGTVTSTTKSREFRIFVGDEAVGDKFVNTESLKSTCHHYLAEALDQASSVTPPPA